MDECRYRIVCQAGARSPRILRWLGEATPLFKWARRQVQYLKEGGEADGSLAPSPSSHPYTVPVSEELPVRADESYYRFS